MAEEVIVNQNQTEGANGDTGTTPVDAPAIPFTPEQITEIADAIVKATDIKSKGIVKSYGDQNGLTLDKETIHQVLEQINAQQKANEPDVDGLNAQIQERDATIAQLKAERAADRLAAATDKLANELGFDVKYSALILNNANPKDAVKEDGTIDAAKLKDAINAFLEENPIFKKPAENSKGFNVGAPKPVETETTPKKPKNHREMVSMIMHNN